YQMLRAVSLDRHSSHGSRDVQNADLLIGDGIVSGTVTREGKPLVGAMVSLVLEPGPDFDGESLQERRVLTRDAGLFVFRDVPPGRWHIEATPPNGPERVKVAKHLDVNGDGIALAGALTVPSGILRGRVFDVNATAIAADVRAIPVNDKTLAPA